MFVEQNIKSNRFISRSQQTQVKDLGEVRGQVYIDVNEANHFKFTAIGPVELIANYSDTLLFDEILFDIINEEGSVQFTNLFVPTKAVFEPFTLTRIKFIKFNDAASQYIQDSSFFFQSPLTPLLNSPATGTVNVQCTYTTYHNPGLNLTSVFPGGSTTCLCVGVSQCATGGYNSYTWGFCQLRTPISWWTNDTGIRSYQQTCCHDKRDFAGAGAYAGSYTGKYIFVGTAAVTSLSQNDASYCCSCTQKTSVIASCISGNWEVRPVTKINNTLFECIGCSPVFACGNFGDVVVGVDDDGNLFTVCGNAGYATSAGCASICLQRKNNIERTFLSSGIEGLSGCNRVSGTCDCVITITTLDKKGINSTITSWENRCTFLFTNAKHRRTASCTYVGMSTLLVRNICPTATPANYCITCSDMFLQTTASPGFFIGHCFDPMDSYSSCCCCNIFRVGLYCDTNLNTPTSAPSLCTLISPIQIQIKWCDTYSDNFTFGGAFLTCDNCYFIWARVNDCSGWSCGSGTNSCIEIYCKCSNSNNFCTTPCVIAGSGSWGTSNKVFWYLKNDFSRITTALVNNDCPYSLPVFNLAICCQATATSRYLCFNNTSNCWQIDTCPTTCYNTCCASSPNWMNINGNLIMNFPCGDSIKCVLTYFADCDGCFSLKDCYYGTDLRVGYPSSPFPNFPRVSVRTADGEGVTICSARLIGKPYYIG